MFRSHFLRSSAVLARQWSLDAAGRTGYLMSDESANKSAHTPPRCPICAQPMRLVRKTLRFHGLPELYTFECRTCDVSLTQERSVPPS